MMRLCVAAALAAFELAGCAAVKGPLVQAVERPAPNWHEVATDSDRQRLRGWRDSWTSAAAAVRAAGEGARFDADPELFDPDHVLADPVPPAGSYQCRWIKLGSISKSAHAFAVFPVESCQVKPAGKLMRFTFTTGPQRPHGVIFPDEASRGTFLGTLELGDETRALAYGRDEQRDMAGFVEQFSPHRWRLILPQPHYESQFDIIELTPVR